MNKFIPNGKYIFIRTLCKQIAKYFALNIRLRLWYSFIKFRHGINLKGLVYFEEGSRLPRWKIFGSLLFS